MQSGNDIAPLFANGRDLTADIGEGLRTLAGTESAGDPLFKLDHSDIALGKIVV